jgi:hypothetical protein
MLPFIIPPRERTMGWMGRLPLGRWRNFVVGNRVEILVDQPGWVVVLLWETGRAGVFASKGDNREIVLGVGKPRSLGPKLCDDLDVVTPAGLVYDGLEPDCSTRTGGEGMTNNTLAPSCRASRHGFL